MITKLTQEQENGIIEWRNKCLEIGYDTTPINKQIVESSWTKFYKILNLDKPKFWYCQSPFQAQVIINLLNIKNKIDTNIRANIVANIGANIAANIVANILGNLWDNIRANIDANIVANILGNIRGNIGDNIEGNIEGNIRDNLWANILGNLWDNIRDNLWYNIWANIDANIRDNIRANIDANIVANILGNIRGNIGDNIEGNIVANIRKIKLKFISTYFYCQHDISWIGYYLYYRNYKLLQDDENFKIFDIWFDLAKSCGWCYTFENIVFVCEKPQEINLDTQNRLHKDGGMALKYSDGYGLYMLHGISVPKYLAVTPADQLNIDFFNKEKNADIKAEFVRKFGIDRLIHLGKSIDKWTNYSNEWWNASEYELIDMSPIFQSIKYAPHLKMKNLTTGIYHLEPVHPDCKTLKDAFEKTRWNGRKLKDYIIQTIK